MQADRANMTVRTMRRCPAAGPRIRRVFANLIDNAVRYGGFARVALHKAPHELTVTVSDEGPEIRRNSFAGPSPLSRGWRLRAIGRVGKASAWTFDRQGYVVLAHGGQISLSNDTQGSKGLIVTVTFPISSAVAQRA